MSKPVLIVNDDDVFIETLKKLLETEGVEAICSTQPLEVLKDLDPDRYGLILIDYKMVGMTGIEFAMLAKARTKSRIALMSAYVDSELEKQAHLSGIRYVVPKTADIDMFVAAVKQLKE